MTFVDSQEPWLGKVPSDWTRSRIRNVAELSPGYSASPPNKDENCTIVPMEKLSDDGLVDTSNQQTSDEIQSGLTSFEKGDVLFAKITPCMENGKGTFIDSLPTRYGFGSTEFHVLRPSKKIDGRFLYYATYNPVFRAYTAENMSGAAGQKRVSSHFLKDTRLFLPTLSEQKKIAAYLDASCSAIDAAVNAKRRQLEKLNTLQKSIIYQAVTQGLSTDDKKLNHNIPNYGFTPRHWHKSKLRFEIAIQNGDFASNRLQDDGEYLVYGGNGIMGRTDTFNVNGETVVIGRVGVYCGNAQYISGKAWVSDNALIVRSKHNAQFLCHLFNALNFNSQANNTAQPVITGTKIKNTYVVLPPKEEQEEICLFIEENIEKLHTIQTNLLAQIDILLAYRKSLIHECVTGKRRITEEDLTRAEQAGSVNMSHLQRY